MSYTSKQSRTFNRKKSTLLHKKSNRSKRKDNRSKCQRIDDHSTIESFPDEVHLDHISYKQHSDTHNNNELIQGVPEGENINQYTTSLFAATHINRNPSGKRRLSATISPLDSSFILGYNEGVQGTPITDSSNNALFMTWTNHVENQSRLHALVKLSSDQFPTSNHNVTFDIQNHQKQPSIISGFKIPIHKKSSSNSVTSNQPKYSNKATKSHHTSHSNGGSRGGKGRRRKK